MLQHGFRHDIVEGSSQLHSTPFAARTLSPDIPPPGARKPDDSAFADTWLLEPVPLPENSSAGFLEVTEICVEGTGRVVPNCSPPLPLRCTHGLSNAEHFDQDLDAAQQRLLRQLAFYNREPILG